MKPMPVGEVGRLTRRKAATLPAKIINNRSEPTTSSEPRHGRRESVARWAVAVSSDRVVTECVREIRSRREGAMADDTLCHRWGQTDRRDRRDTIRRLSPRFPFDEITTSRSTDHRYWNRGRGAGRGRCLGVGVVESAPTPPWTPPPAGGPNLGAPPPPRPAF